MMADSFWDGAAAVLPGTAFGRSVTRLAVQRRSLKNGSHGLLCVPQQGFPTVQQFDTAQIISTSRGVGDCQEGFGLAPAHEPGGP